MGTQYMECFGKKDPECIATLYTPDGIFVSARGVTTPVANYTRAFEAGAAELETKVKEVHPVGKDGAIGIGTFQVTGKDKEGKIIGASGTWTAVYVKNGDKLKVRMLTSVPDPVK